MQDLIIQERFEFEVLDRLNSGKFLTQIVFDMEFLFKKGVPLDASDDTLREVLRLINAFSRRDYTVRLGSLLEKEQREYYSVENFKILKRELSVVKYQF